ncbi:PhnD/SsuA/transferrin family substrate-binding protein [Arcobacter sp. LA11]|uniref:PhnD/SsuA/transferrin family substrate-binding protein n=1 Tax=Arcobacter sp. LA11 TaxID=1898176 RepID=UPI00093507DD|nr:PhnD/SsuA/transferrin family substrate-binding protein [Arcobacter sp. LA11]
MRNFKYLYIILFLALSLNAVNKDLTKEYYFGVAINKFNKANQNRIKYLLLRLTNEMQSLYKAKINIVFIENDKDLLKDFQSFNKMNAMVVYTNFYLQNKEELKKVSMNPFLFNSASQEKNQYYLIANKESNIKTVKDLKNKTYAGYVADDGYEVWLDYIVRKELNTSIENIIKEKNIKQKNKKLLLDVYFNKSDFTVVSKVVYNDMLLLNPAIEKNTVIIEKSEPIFFFGLGLFHKNTPKELVEDFFKIVDNGDFNRKFKELFLILNLYGLQKTSFEDLRSLDTYYDEYNRLKKSN